MLTLDFSERVASSLLAAFLFSFSSGASFCNESEVTDGGDTEGTVEGSLSSSAHDGRTFSASCVVSPLGTVEMVGRGKGVAGHGVAVVFSGVSLFGSTAASMSAMLSVSSRLWMAFSGAPTWFWCSAVERDARGSDEEEEDVKAEGEASPSSWTTDVFVEGSEASGGGGAVGLDFWDGSSGRVELEMGVGTFGGESTFAVGTGMDAGGAAGRVDWAAVPLAFPSPAPSF